MGDVRALTIADPVVRVTLEFGFSAVRDDQNETVHGAFVMTLALVVRGDKAADVVREHGKFNALAGAWSLPKVGWAALEPLLDTKARNELETWRSHERYRHLSHILRAGE